MKFGLLNHRVAVLLGGWIWQFVSSSLIVYMIINAAMYTTSGFVTKHARGWSKDRHGRDTLTGC